MNPDQDVVWVEGTIQSVENLGSLLSLVVVDGDDNRHVVTGDWRPMSLILDDVISRSGALGLPPSALVVRVGAHSSSCGKQQMVLLSA